MLWCDDKKAQGITEFIGFPSCTLVSLVVEALVLTTNDTRVPKESRFTFEPSI